jgi:hypothetical protein
VTSADGLLPALRRAINAAASTIIAVPIDPRENAKLGDVL